MWMDPVFMDGQDPNVFGRSPNLNDTISRLRYKKLINETRFAWDSYSKITEKHNVFSTIANPKTWTYLQPEATWKTGKTFAIKSV